MAQPNISQASGESRAARRTALPRSTTSGKVSLMNLHAWQSCSSNNVSRSLEVSRTLHLCG